MHYHITPMSFTALNSLLLGRGHNLKMGAVCCRW